MSSPNLNIVTLLGSSFTYVSAYLFGMQEQDLFPGTSMEVLVQVGKAVGTGVELVSAGRDGCIAHTHMQAHFLSCNLLSYDPSPSACSLMTSMPSLFFIRIKSYHTLSIQQPSLFDVAKTRMRASNAFRARATLDSLISG